MADALPNPDQTLNAPARMNRALSPVLLTGIFSAIFTLSWMIVFAPQFFQTLIGATLAGIIGLALVILTFFQSTVILPRYYFNLFNRVLSYYFGGLTCKRNG